MLEGIRQFFTFEESLRTSNAEFPGELYTWLHRHDLRPYFAALEMLRGHFYRCIALVAVVVNTEVPKISAHMRYEDAWQLEAYEKPEIMARNAQGH